MRGRCGGVRLALVIITTPVETKGKRVLRGLIPQMSHPSGQPTTSRCVHREVIRYDNPAIRRGGRGELTWGECLLSKLVKRDREITEQRRRRRAQL